MKSNTAAIKGDERQECVIGEGVGMWEWASYNIDDWIKSPNDQQQTSKELCDSS